MSVIHLAQFLHFFKFKILLDPFFIWTNIVLHLIIVGLNLVWDCKFILDEKLFWTTHFWTNTFWTNIFV